MDERKLIARQLQEIEQQMKELEICYEKYFAGIEKLEPIKLRETVTRKLRHFANRRIIQTDIRYKYQNLATRFHSYCGQWDRILRLMDEGKYVRQLSRIKRAAPASAPANSKSNGNGGGHETDDLYQDLIAAHKSCHSESRTPAKEQVDNFLKKQRQRLKEKYGDRKIEFQVITSGGKPKIQVKAKKQG